MSPIIDTAPRAVIPLHGDRPSLGDHHSPTPAREAVVAAIHEYGTARAEGDLCLSRIDLSAEETARLIGRIGRAWASIHEELATAIIDHFPSGALLARVSHFGALVVAYGDDRRAGLDQSAARDAIVILDEILDLCKGSQN